MACLKKDHQFLERSFMNDNEPGTTRFIRMTCKAFAMGADDKSGCFGPFSLYVKPFLKASTLYSLHLLPYRGSRFNILFENASGVYFLHTHMAAFLESYTPTNRLLNAVLHDLRVPQYIAGPKALGLIGKLITSPFWCLLEDKTNHIMDMDKYYLQLVTFLTNVGENPVEFMAGNLLPFGDKSKVHRDAVYEALLQPGDPEIHSIVQATLSVLLPAMATTCRHLFRNHLPGGKYADLYAEESADVRSRTKKSVPKSSKFAESVFGSLDHLMRNKPRITTISPEAYIMFGSLDHLMRNKPRITTISPEAYIMFGSLDHLMRNKTRITTISLEAYIMFSNNKTMDWLKCQDKQIQKQLLQESRKEVKDVRRFKERQQSIEEGQRKRMEEKKI